MSQHYSDESSQLTELQSHIQSQLGYCMLQLQQCEELLTRMLPYKSHCSRPEDLLALLADAADFVGSKTRKALVSMLMKTVHRPRCLVSETPDSCEVSYTESSSASSCTQLVPEAESYNAIRVSLKELVALRNLLTHEFLSKFDIGRLEGCIAAEAFLSSSSESINAHLTILRNWPQTIMEAHESMAIGLAAPAVQLFLCDGIAPDGTIHWSRSGIVLGLQDAEADLASNGWTLLDSAIAWMGQHVPEETPKRYGCISWRQVLHDCKQFDVFKQSLANVSNTQQATGVRVWYRSRRRPLEV